MLPVGAFAVALLLNGAQILLPSPAFVEHGRTWAPARAVFERLGDKVRWEPARQAMVVQHGTRAAVFPLGLTPTLDGHPLSVDATARRVETTVYVPLVALRALGLKVQWEHDDRLVSLTSATAASAATLAAILADPLAWSEQEVTLTGEYSGWDGDPFCFATRLGPPVSTGDWVLHNEDGSLYCSPALSSTALAAPSLSRLTSALPPLTPYSALGQRFAVTGTIKLTRKAVPYLLFSGLSRPGGLAGLTCRLVLDRQACDPGEPVGYTIVLANAQPTRVVLGGQRDWLISVAAPDGNMYVSKQSFEHKTSEPGALAPGEQLTLHGSWRLPRGAEVGNYAITARLSDEIGTYRRYFAVQPSPEIVSRQEAGE